MVKENLNEKTTVSLQMPNELLAKLNDTAKEKSLSVSALVRLILLDYFYFEAQKAKGEMNGNN